MSRVTLHGCGLSPRLLIATGLLLSGCTPTQWVAGPGQTSEAFEASKGNCQLVASGADQGLIAVGTPAFVGSAKFGNAMGNAIRERQAFNACMRASGFVVADKQTLEGMSERKAEVKEIMDERRACFAALRTRPEFADITAHMTDTQTHTYTIEQLSDQSMPTQDQEREVAAYFDEAHVCQSRAVTALNNFLPAAAQVLTEATERSDAEAIEFAQGKLTWGQFASGEHQLSLQSRAALSHVSML